MSDVENETQNEVRHRLEEMWQELNGRSRSTAENHIEEYNESIVKEIVNGDLELSNRMIELKTVRNKHDIEMSIRQEILKRAEREKQQLENKLKYVSHSIYTLKEAESSPRFHGNQSQRYKEGEEPDEPKVDLKQRAVRFKKEMEERSKRLAALKREADLKQQLKENERKQQEEQRQKAENQKHKQQLEQNIRKIRERMQKRQMEVKDGNQRIKQLLAKDKMFEKLEVGYLTRQHSLLQERKRKLSEIRNLYRPIDHDQLASHQQRFMEYQKEKEELRERERKMMAQRNYQVPYESVFYKRIKEKQEQQTDSGLEKAKLEKIKMFAEHVKDNFKPQVDPNKKKELEDILRKEQQHQQVKEQKQKELLDKAKKKGLQYLSQLKSMPRPIAMPTLRQSSPKAASSTRTEYKNYITRTENKPNPWKRILSSSKDSSDNKALRVYYESMRIQEQLKRKEQITKLHKSRDCEDIDQGYYEMIKAKLHVLDNK